MGHLFRKLNVNKYLKKGGRGGQKVFYVFSLCLKISLMFQTWRCFNIPNSLVLDSKKVPSLRSGGYRLTRTLTLQSQTYSCPSVELSV